MKYIRIFTIVLTGLLILAGCGQSYEETKRLSREQRLKLAREDSAALKIAVMPTLDCLPIFIAKDHQLFDTVVDIRLKRYTADERSCRGNGDGSRSSRTDNSVRYAFEIYRHDECLLATDQ